MEDIIDEKKEITHQKFANQIDLVFENLEKVFNDLMLQYYKY